MFGMLYTLCRWGGYIIQADDLAVHVALGETLVTKLKRKTQHEVYVCSVIKRM